MLQWNEQQYYDKCGRNERHMKNIRKAVAPLCAAGILAVSLTGCGKKSPLDPGNPVSLTIWHYYNGSQQAAFDALVEEFNDSVGRE